MAFELQSILSPGDIRPVTGLRVESCDTCKQMALGHLKGQQRPRLNACQQLDHVNPHGRAGWDIKRSEKLKLYHYASTVQDLVATDVSLAHAAA